MKEPVPAFWAERYSKLLQGRIIRDKCVRYGTPIDALATLDAEAVSGQVETALKAIFLPTARVVEIIRCELQRAHAHALNVYRTPHDAAAARYHAMVAEEVQMPSLITGPAGVGKTQVRRAISRLLSERLVVRADESLQRHELESYAEICVGGHRSVAQMLGYIASPGRRTRVGKIGSVPEMISDCASWLRLKGTCLVGVDEMQFLAQSSNASTLITNAMLAIGSLATPWFCIANYSMCAKLLARPPEATQRLLGRPVLLLPDGPVSPDWIELMTEYDRVLSGCIDFRCVDRAAALWSLSAGLKRELVKLISIAAKVCFERKAVRMSWADVESAYHSIPFFASRRDIELMIRHAGQRGSAPRDLACPFGGEPLQQAHDQYAKNLQSARQSTIAQSVIVSSMTATERAAVDILKTPQRKEPKVVPLKRRQKLSVESLTEAGLARIDGKRKETDS